jgi:hypothetical protein
MVNDSVEEFPVGRKEDIIRLIVVFLITRCDADDLKVCVTPLQFRNRFHCIVSIRVRKPWEKPELIPLLF